MRDVLRMRVPIPYVVSPFAMSFVNLPLFGLPIREERGNRPASDARGPLASTRRSSSFESSEQLAARLPLMPSQRPRIHGIAHSTVSVSTMTCPDVRNWVLDHGRSPCTRWSPTRATVVRQRGPSHHLVTDDPRHSAVHTPPHSQERVTRAAPDPLRRGSDRTASRQSTASSETRAVTYMSSTGP